MKTIEEALNNAINHRVRLLYVTKMESTLRETDGILKNVTKDVITIKSTGSFGKWRTQYINRHACGLLCIEDWGEYKE